MKAVKVFDSASRNKLQPLGVTFNGQGKSIYVSSFAPIVKVICRAEIDEAKKRVSVSSKGYYYKPSEAYLNKYSKVLDRKVF